MNAGDLVGSPSGFPSSAIWYSISEVNAFAKDVARGLIIIAADAAYSFRWQRRRRSEATTDGPGGVGPGGDLAIEGAGTR